MTKKVPSVQVELPLLQNWSCHSCGGCCKQHEIELTRDERDRIEAQGWTAADGIAGPTIDVRPGPIGTELYFLQHVGPEGACVFLDDNGRCRIHAKFGEPAKPLACRVYPYAFHPSSRGITTSLRFSCPSVVQNRGQPLSVQREVLQELVQQVTGGSKGPWPAPLLVRNVAGTWPAIDALVDAVESIWRASGGGVRIATYKTLALVHLLPATAATIVAAKDPRRVVAPLLGGLHREGPGNEQLPPPSKLARLYLRLFTAQFVRRDTAATRRQGWRGRLHLLQAILKVSMGWGDTPRLNPAFPPVRFADLTGATSSLPASFEALWTRYVLVKLRGLHHCGPAFFGWSFADGLMMLMMMAPVVVVLARWHALGQRRSDVNEQDVEAALTAADHHFGYNSQLGASSAQHRLNPMLETGDFMRLVAWYVPSPVAPAASPSSNSNHV